MPPNLIAQLRPKARRALSDATEQPPQPLAHTRRVEQCLLPLPLLAAPLRQTAALGERRTGRGEPAGAEGGRKREREARGAACRRVFRVEPGGGRAELSQALKGCVTAPAGGRIGIRQRVRDEREQFARQTRSFMLQLSVGCSVQLQQPLELEPALRLERPGRTRCA